MFHVKKADFLGYVVATDGVTMNEKKVESIKSWKAPGLVKDIQIFIGFADFYPRFIKNFSAICTPITNLLKGDPEQLSCRKEPQEAFEDLKRQFILAPILCHFYPDLNTVVETDARDYALGCILLQFHSKRLIRGLFTLASSYRPNEIMTSTIKSGWLSLSTSWNGDITWKERKSR